MVLLWPRDDGQNNEASKFSIACHISRKVTKDLMLSPVRIGLLLGIRASSSSVKFCQCDYVMSLMSLFPL